MNTEVQNELARLRLRVAELEAQLASAGSSPLPAFRPRTEGVGPLGAVARPVHSVLHTLIDTMPVGLIVCDAAGKIVLVNVMARLLFDGGPAHTVFDFVDSYTLHRPDGTPIAREDRPLVRAITAGEVTRNVEVLVRHPGGHETTLLASAVPVRDATGIVTGAVAAYQDITQRKAFENDLRNSEARLRAILDTAVDGIITIDEHGIIESVNPTAQKIFGYAAEEMVGRNVSLLMPEPYRSEHDRYIESYLRTGRRKIIGIGREVQGVRRDGTVFPLYLAVSEVRLNGKRIFTGIARDMTDQKRVEAALRSLNDTLEQRVFERTRELLEANQALTEADERFRQIADAIPQVVWIGPPDLSRTLYVNQAYQKVWGRPPEDLYADTRSAVEAVHPDDRDRFASRFFGGLVGQAAPQDVEEQFRVVWPDGRERQVIGRAFPIRDEQGEVYRICAIFEDMTEHLRLEKEVLEISESERRRIGRDLHDTLGQVLTGVLFLTRVLQQTLSGRQAPEAANAEEIVQQVTHAIELTRALSRGLVPVEMKAEGLMNGLRDFAERAAKVMGITCRFHAGSPVLIHDGAAATHLYHIAQEATNNAVKHGRARHVDIRLHASGQAVTLTVEDDGAGIPENVDPARGMGLRIMTYRARMIGGQLSVRRRSPDGGTVVECTFKPEQAGVETPAGR